MVAKKAVNPKFLIAVGMMYHSIDNSRAYSNTVKTEEQRREQLDRVQSALDKVQYMEVAALERCYVNPRILK